ncbi:DHA2 family efflux MFS transporter permease subunit [Thiorhodococcus mannitoliphagus]|uniref:DHA2 family efflux MFS transporter permease subunit n=1 Tax=Thiorhodococcus mannitoliphagus TaxID=329406 RepID=A0A6P1E5W8_9GAMM|nr:DHA2 family efflux MFS transporter permease subunit [Thiorhodococcus mannitoliphagus]NEX23424.1 DHA2 family efflux MFS transporter permease subunit [Thiorhodococcus mannitoliphagus]
MSDIAVSGRILPAASVMLTTVMAIMDMTIVNVTLPHMMGALGATADQVTWVLTAYIVAEAVTIPLTGWLAARFGRRRVMLVGIAGFVLASAACGLSESLSQMVFFRLLQGVAGAPLIPLSQGVLVNLFPAEQRGKAMAIWGIGVMLGPVLGPTIGGLVTEHLNWRWVFYINLPIGLLNLAMVARSIRETPRQAAGTDWLGALLMIVGIGSLQTLLDRGNQEGWFESGVILLLTLTVVAGLALFVWRGLTAKQPIVDLRLFADRNLALASTLMLVFGLALFGTIAIQPLLMERLLGYPVETTGLVMAPRGFGAAFGMLIVARLAGRVDARWIIATGMTLAGVATWIMSWYNLDISPGWLIWPGVLQGVGMGSIFVTLSTLAYATLPASQTDAGAGLYNLARSIGSSIGVSIAATWYSRFGQADWNQLGGHINPFNPALHHWLQVQGLTLSSPNAAVLLTNALSRQSSMLAFTQVFGMIALSFVLMLPLLLLLKPSARK